MTAHHVETGFIFAIAAGCLVMVVFSIAGKRPLYVGEGRRRARCYEVGLALLSGGLALNGVALGQNQPSLGVLGSIVLVLGIAVSYFSREPV